MLKILSASNPSRILSNIYSSSIFVSLLPLSFSLTARGVATSAFVRPHNMFPISFDCFNSCFRTPHSRTRRYASSTTDAASSQDERLISFVTDIEGDKAYLDRFVDISKILDFEPVKPNLSPGNDFFPYDRHIVFKHADDENHMLLFGGDVCDKGGNDLYVIRQLLSLKKRYGDRVQFILGNRDINKMRIVQELGINSSTSLNEKLVPHGGVNWLRNTGLQGDPVCIDKYFSTTDEDERKELESILIPNVSSERLKWILRKTMGSPDAYEFRHNELLEEKQFIEKMKGNSGDNVEVSDEEVVVSYKSSCHPKGLIGEYLANGKLSFKVGRTLFLHGSMPFSLESVLSNFEQSMSTNSNENTDKKQDFWKWLFQYMTPFKHNDLPETLDQWLHSLNTFHEEQMNAWKQNMTLKEQDSFQEQPRDLPYDVHWSTVGGYQNSHFGSLCEYSMNPEKSSSDASSPLGFGSLCQYGMGWLADRSKNPTVVYNSWMEDGSPKYFDENNQRVQLYKDIVDAFFEEANIDAIVTGHQPVGDLPFPIRVGKNYNKMIVCGDTSYSGDTKWMDCDRSNLGRGNSPLKGRGEIAVSEVILKECLETGKVISIQTHGMMSDGSDYSSEISMGSDKLVGRPADRDILSFEGSVRDDSSDTTQWFVKAQLNAKEYLVSSGKGYDVFNSVAHKKII